MRKKRLLSAVALVAAVGLMISFSGCEITGDGGSITFNFTLDNITGTVIDARSDSTTLAGIADVEVTLEPIDTSEGGTDVLTATSDSSGEYEFEDVETGTYKLTAEKSGYFFFPIEVSVGGWLQELPEVPGVQLRAEDAWGISFVLMWNNGEDMDLYITYPDTDLSSDSDTGTSFYSPDSTYAYNWHNGFGPSDADTTGNREQVYYGNKESTAYVYGSSTIKAVVLDRDDTKLTGGYGPETGTLRDIPFTFTTSTYPISPTTANGLSAIDSGIDYRWMGVTEVYIDGYSANIATADSTGARPYVAAFQTVDDGAGNLSANNLGFFPIPDYMELSTISVIRVNMFYASDTYVYFQLIPDITTSNQIKGAVAEPIIVRGPKR